MKSKRILSFALVAVMCLCFAFAFNITQPQASARVRSMKISGHQYTLEYLLEDMGFAKLEGKSNFSDGRYVEYRLSKIDNGTTEGITVNETDTEAHTEAAFKKVENNKVEFLNVGEYTFRVYLGTDKTTLEGEGEVFTSKLSKDGSINYNLDDTVVDAYEELVKTEAAAHKVGDSFTVPTAKTIISSNYFEYAELDKTIYYASSNSTTYSSTSSTSFKITEAGVYSFYVLATDPCQVKSSTDGLVIGPNGWYKDEDEDGKRDDENVIIPVFTFEISKVSKPTITTGTSEKGFLDLQYTADCFTIEATNYNSEYKLYYSETALAGVDYEFDNDDADAVEAYNKALTEAIEDKKLEDLSDKEVDGVKFFNKSTLQFTPDAKGYYYVGLTVKDAYNEEAVAVSRPIIVEGSFQTYKPVNQFVRNNITSIVFLTISIVSFIAIIILLFIKPKEKEVVLETKNNSNK